MNDADKIARERIIAGIAFGFAGWLTTRDKELVISSHNDAAPVAEAVAEYLREKWNITDVEPDFYLAGLSLKEPEHA